MKTSKLTFQWITFAILSFALLITACQTKKKVTNGSADMAHNSQNSLDWAGNYQGTLPCADCPGIRTTLSLEEGGTFTLKTQYLEKNDSVYVESGQFKWDATGGAVTLADGRKFQVGENQLIQLDMEGNKITGDLATHYVLAKLDDSITEKYWKLVELNGQPVEAGSTNKEAHIKLRIEGNRMEGTGGCNGIGGTYELNAPNRIKFSKVISTQMACQNMEIETELIRVLQNADSYHLEGDSLQLFRARMAPLAKFEAVYFN